MKKLKKSEMLSRGQVLSDWIHAFSLLYGTMQMPSVLLSLLWFSASSLNGVVEMVRCRLNMWGQKGIYLQRWTVTVLWSSFIASRTLNICTWSWSICLGVTWWLCSCGKIPFLRMKHASMLHSLYWQFSQSTSTTTSIGLAFALCVLATVIEWKGPWIKRET